MTKKHLEAIAAMFASLPGEPNYVMVEWEEGFDFCVTLAVRRMADVCARFNPAFDRGRFLRACRGE